ncbi:hypothetical protein Q3G72_003810 [Acer saccharum]|nr:hypothetical protein Q3G72_003810 [Acer saccharum]
MNVKISLVNSSSSAPPNSSDTSSTSIGLSMKVTRDRRGGEGCFNNFLKSIEKLGETEMQTDEIKSNSLSLQYPSGQTTSDRSLLLCPRCQRNIVNKMCNVSISSAKTNLRNEAGFGNGPKTLSKVKTQTTLFLLSLAAVAFFRRPSQLFLHLWSSSIRETLKTYMETSQVNLKLLIDTKNVGSLKEKIVVLGVDEGLELLKASLECKNALTSVFLSKIEVE